MQIADGSRHFRWAVVKNVNGVVAGLAVCCRWRSRRQRNLIDSPLESGYNGGGHGDSRIPVLTMMSMADLNLR